MWLLTTISIHCNTPLLPSDLYILQMHHDQSCNFLGQHRPSKNYFHIYFAPWLEQILREEITPTLKRLKEERSSYLEYQKVTREVEQLSRISIAFQFVQAEV